jgi:hypothetical protein
VRGGLGDDQFGLLGPGTAGARVQVGGAGGRVGAIGADHGGGPGDGHRDAEVVAGDAARVGQLGLLREAALEAILANNTDLIADTPWARLCLTGYLAFAEAIARNWLAGHASRPDAQHALTDTLLHLLTDTIPSH